VKEANALTEFGYEVHVIAGDYHPWGHEADEQYRNREWTLERISYGAMASPSRRAYLGGRKRVAEILAGLLPQNVTGVYLRAHHWVIPELVDRARAVEADLFVAHYLPALPAAVQAACEQNAKLGFDAEDFHRGQYEESEKDSLDARLTRWFEEKYIPKCDYVTAASPGVRNAYADVLEIEGPTPILNVFPRSERSGHTPPDELQTEHPGSGISLYWYSQTIGPGRGLEMVIRAMGAVHERLDGQPRLVLSLRGSLTDRYEAELRTLARSVGLEDSQLRHLPRASPDQLIERAAEHDIGLALEQAKSKNRDICITNKIFAYLLAGLPVLATDTEGQRFVHDHAPEAVRVAPVGNVEAMADQLLQWAECSEERKEASEAARHAADERFNWDVEKETLRDTVGSILEV